MLRCNAAGGRLSGELPTREITLPESQGGFRHSLERFPNGLNREGFPNQQRSDSSCMLVKGASMHGQSSID
jgi:hypothetical protein